MQYLRRATFVVFDIERQTIFPTIPSPIPSLPTHSLIHHYPFSVYHKMISLTCFTLILINFLEQLLCYYYFVYKLCILLALITLVLFSHAQCECIDESVNPPVRCRNNPINLLLTLNWAFGVIWKLVDNWRSLEH